MKLGVKYLVLVFIPLFGFLGNASALSYPKGSVGQDISWPNCSNLKFSPASFGIVGVNGGLSFHPNNCIGAEASLYRQNLSLYVNTGFPGYPRDQLYKSWPFNCSSNDTNCLAYNYGFNAGRYATDYALEHGVVSNNWWLDVETVNSWSANININNMSLLGETNAIAESVNPTILGYYTNPPEWKILTNDIQNYLPNWVASNSNYKNIAVKQCTGFSFNSGKTLLTQYIGKLDLDITC
jgi:hypothetical protein